MTCGSAPFALDSAPSNQKHFSLSKAKGYISDTSLAVHGLASVSQGADFDVNQVPIRM